MTDDEFGELNQSLRKKWQKQQVDRSFPPVIDGKWGRTCYGPRRSFHRNVQLLENEKEVFLHGNFTIDDIIELSRYFVEEKEYERDYEE